MKAGGRIYRICFIIARIFIGLIYRFDIKGRENIPKGSAMICANHSSNIDPFFLAFALGVKNRIHIVAKAELFKLPLLSALLNSMGMIRVDRGISDVTTVKKTLGYLKTGEKVAIFPEGTRVAEDDVIAAKNGAVKLAERTCVPIVPVFIPRSKKPFSKITLIIGSPYLIEAQDTKRTQEQYAELAGALMEKIKLLSQTV